MAPTKVNGSNILKYKQHFSTKFISKPVHMQLCILGSYQQTLAVYE